VLFFPNTSIRTRVTFEKGIYLLGGRSILFPTETLDKKEKLEDVCEYLYSRAMNFAAMPLESFARESGCNEEEHSWQVSVIVSINNWSDAVIVRHRNMDVIRKLVQYSAVPIINAMTDMNHPCEIISDMYSLSKIRVNFTKDKYFFCGKAGNIGLSWREAAFVRGTTGYYDLLLNEPKGLLTLCSCRAAYYPWEYR